MVNKGDSIDPHHYIFDKKDKGLCHIDFLLVFLPIITFFRFFLRILKAMAHFCKLFKDINGISMDWKIELSINEALGNYWNCIPGSNQMKMYV
jgi:hypothetical protein